VCPLFWDVTPCKWTVSKQRIGLSFNGLKVQKKLFSDILKLENEGKSQLHGYDKPRNPQQQVVSHKAVRKFYIHVLFSLDSLFYNGKVKVNFGIEQGIKAHRGSESIALLFL
jgi:hypothetical protein